MDSCLHVHRIANHVLDYGGCTLYGKIKSKFPHSRGDDEVLKHALIKEY
jgi:hypothetical protein